VGLDDSPDHRVIEGVVAVAKEVADAGDVAPGNPGVPGLEVVRDVAGGFRDDLDASLRGQTEPA
jgi:hypothetical protein